MRALWAWLGIAFGGLILGYAALVALSGLDLPWTPRHFDTHVTVAGERGWVNEARYVMLNKHVFAAPGDRIVVLGASTSRDPFRPALIEPALPGWQFANASLSGANIDEQADAVDVYNATRGPGRTVFVFALTYLQFKPLALPPGGDNPFASEAARAGLYARTGGVLTPRYPAPVENLVLAALRPQAIAASLPRRLQNATIGNPDLPALKAFFDRFRGKDPLSQWTEAIGEARDLNALTPPPAMQRALLAQRLAGRGDTPYPDHEYVRLLHTLRAIRARNDLAVIVDLPLPKWHSAGVPRLEASTDARLRAIVASFGGDPGIARISFREFDADENFYDSGHTKPRLWPVMSARLSAALKPFLAANR